MPSSGGMGTLSELPVRFPSLLALRSAKLLLWFRGQRFCWPGFEWYSPSHWKAKGLVHTQVGGCSLLCDHCGQTGIWGLTWPGLLTKSEKPQVFLDFYFSGKVAFFFLAVQNYHQLCQHECVYVCVSPMGLVSHPVITELTASRAPSASMQCRNVLAAF